MRRCGLLTPAPVQSDSKPLRTAMIKVLIADDHLVVRPGLKQFLAEDLSRLRLAKPATPVLILSMHPEDQFAVR